MTSIRNRSGFPPGTSSSNVEPPPARAEKRPLAPADSDTLIGQLQTLRSQRSAQPSGSVRPRVALPVAKKARTETKAAPACGQVSKLPASAHPSAKRAPRADKPSTADRDREYGAVSRMWKLMKDDWSGLLEDYQEHCDGKATGPALVRAFRDAVERSEPDDKLQIGLSHVRGFRIQLHEKLPTVTVLAVGDGIDRKMLLAPSDSPAVLKKIAERLASQAKRTAASKGAGKGVAFDEKQHDLWKLLKQDPVLQQVASAWRAGDGANQGGEYFVLEYLQGLMTAAGGEVPDKDRPDISRFRFDIPRLDGGADLLCRVDEDGKIADAKGVPAGTQDVGHLLHDMKSRQEFRQKLQGRRPAIRAQGEGERDNKRLVMKLADDLSGEFEAFCGVKKRGANRQSFFRHLNGLCDDAEAQSEIADKDNNIRRYVVTPLGSKKAITLLRRLDEQGKPQTLRVVLKPSDEQVEIKKIGSFLKSEQTKAAARAKASPLPATAPVPTAAVASASGASKKPRQIAEAIELVDLLKQLAENKRLKRPPMHDMEKATGIAETEAWRWVKPDGTLKRKPSAVYNLRGYTEWREELRGLLKENGDPTQLPGWLNTAELVELVLAHKEHPDFKPAKLADLIDKSEYSVKLVFNGQYFALSNDRLRSLPDYAQHWRALETALQHVGHARKLRPPEGLADTFLRQLDDHRYLIRLVMGEMQGDPKLSIAEAARRVTLSAEVKDVAGKLLAPGGALRTLDQISADLPKLDAKQLQELQQQLGQLETKRTAGEMATRMVKAQGHRPAKVFILPELQKVAPSQLSRQRQLTTLETMYKDNQQQVAMPRSYTGQRERQVLRWLSTVIKEVLFPAREAREVQAYWDAETGTVWLASNNLGINRKIAAYLEQGSLVDALKKDLPEVTKARSKRHLERLREELARIGPAANGTGKPNDGKQGVREESGRDVVLTALCAGKIMLPTKPVINEKTGFPAQRHAERWIKEAFEEATGRKVDWRLMAGVMRPCGTCAKDLGLPSEAHRGPFWISQAAQDGYDIEALIQESLDAGIGTIVSELRGGDLDLYANTDSESDSEDDGGKQPPGKRKASTLGDAGLTTSGLDARPAKRPAEAPTLRPSASAAWPIVQDERDFIRAFVGHDVSSPRQARQALREAVVAQIQRFNSAAWHREDAFADLETVLEAVRRHGGEDITRAMRLAADLGEPLQEMVLNSTVRQRQTDLRQLHEQAQQATTFLRDGLGVDLPFEVPVGRQQTQQVLQTLLDQGAGRFRSLMRRTSKNAQATPKEKQALALARHYGELRRSSAMLGWLPDEGSPTHPLRGERLPEGNLWRPEDVGRVFTQGQAAAALTPEASTSGSDQLPDEPMSNICWFDAVAQLKLGKDRGKCTAEEVDVVEHLARHLRLASDALGMSRKDDMFDGDNGAMHVIAHALRLQIHTFQQQPEGLGLTPLQSVGSPSDPAVYLHCNDTHYEPMWRKPTGG